MTDKLITSADTGMASIETDKFKAVELFAGDSPRPTTSHQVDDSLLAGGLPAFSVVGLSGGRLVLAKTSSTAVVPMGITTASVAPGSQTGVTVAVFRGGDYNVDALNWHSDYNTDAAKIGAFDGSKEAIFIRKLQYQA